MITFSQLWPWIQSSQLADAQWVPRTKPGVVLLSWNKISQFNINITYQKINQDVQMNNVTFGLLPGSLVSVTF